MVWCAFAEFTRFDGIPAQMTKAQVPLSWLPWLASVKALALVGIGVGFFVPVVGTAAAAGVAVYFVGAIVKHIMAHDAGNAGGAISFLLLASAALILRVAASSAYGLSVLAG
jgi:hypothetical protein